TPGHSQGCISLSCGDVLFTGDTLFAESVGRTDLPFSSPRDLEKSLAKLMKFDDKTAVYPGHGRPTTIGHERAHNPFL
ncbi:MAG: MBL fold metallo-hydrolase, partial [Candidatus Omnitrophica bacterium]|nr:MBL fold metallo-hydrolase [Candidatus Omnitrophota bacterium]